MKSGFYQEQSDFEASLIAIGEFGRIIVELVACLVELSELLVEFKRTIVEPTDYLAELKRS